MHPAAAALAVLAATLAGACLRDQDGTTSDATMSCNDLAARLHARALGTSVECTIATDCAQVGFPEDSNGFPTCNCAASFAQSCSGDAVNAAAWSGDATAQAMLAEWYQRCAGAGAPDTPTVCDCGPGGVRCVQQRCMAGIRDCFALDAGVPPSP